MNMQHRTKTLLTLVVAMAAFAMAPADASAGNISPWGDVMTESYRIAFATSTTTHASSSDIGYYNTFVVDAAGSAGSIVDYLGVDWKVIGSVKGGIDAKTNTDTSFGISSANVPIYILDGTLLAAGNELLWNGTSEYKINRNQTGASDSEGVFTGDTLFKGTVGGTLAPGHSTFADLKRSIMDVLMKLPHDLAVYPGHTDFTTVGEEWEGNPFVRIWRGVDTPEVKHCTAMGQPADLVLRAMDYDGGTKCWVRFDDGGDEIAPGSKVVDAD